MKESVGSDRIICLDMRACQQICSFYSCIDNKYHFLSITQFFRVFVMHYVGFCFVFCKLNHSSVKQFYWLNFMRILVGASLGSSGENRRKSTVLIVVMLK